ncbi:hypothetical protein SERLADRAFT_460080 [Serpula lacrymans var. lacrymans S7.9]|uniref:Uncharacterized protein n=1 Tax=Serpula lacrymans var. lacrymans (strain S7.9) TaxID=578457 RepID=F8NPE8_SERL9|nr:uncharacterized protein SERLADRAFT_460080 [Serpula lacrymans var. lacrymans S7.9]EGO27158.1 hypothetical protein SERLADRAFT_460080 [Serpula lacrymans var. lacrymans S7.9]
MNEECGMKNEALMKDRFSWLGFITNPFMIRRPELGWLLHSYSFSSFSQFSFSFRPAKPAYTVYDAHMEWLEWLQMRKE